MMLTLTYPQNLNRLALPSTSIPYKIAVPQPAPPQSFIPSIIFSSCITIFMWTITETKMWLLWIVALLPLTKGMIVDPCSPNPCGQNTRCYVSNNNRPVCSCLPGYWGNPLTHCQRGECQDNLDCPNNKACRDYQCINVCAGKCGANAECTVRNHIPICSCPPQHTGDPFVSCRRIDPEELCRASPCGHNTKCEVINNVPTCSCLPGYIGSPISGCRHECDSDYDCSSSQVCQNFKCVPVCRSGACAPNANCEVSSHRAICTCPKGYFGNPYISCRAECVTNGDCPSDRPACIREQCMNPCNGVCGINANCELRGVTPVCSCPKTMTGDPFTRCRPFEPEDLCNRPNICGENAQCQPGYDNTGKDRPVCTCLPGFVGDPLTYCRRGECTTDNECRHDQICLNYECKSVCADQCGINAVCNSRNHVAVCSCPPGYTGNAITRCYADNPKKERLIYYNTK